MKSQPPNRRRPPKVPRPTAMPLAESPTLKVIIGRLEKEEISAPEANHYLENLLSKGTPLIEEVPGNPDERIVTFLHRDEKATDVLIFINRITDEKNLQQSLLRQIGTTPFRFLSLQMKADWRASYCFLHAVEGELPPWKTAENQVQIRAALDAGELDPANNRTCINSVGAVLSVVELPDAPEQLYIESAELVPVSWIYTKSQRKCAALRIGEGENLPLVLILDGEKWSQQGLISMLEAAQYEGYLPALAVGLVHSGGRELRWQELDGTFPYTSFLVDDVIPRVQEKIGVQKFSSIVVVGQSLGGLSAIVAALERPDVFTAVVSSSASLWLDTANEKLEQALKSGREARDYPCFFIEVGEQEWVLLPPHLQFRDSLVNSGFNVVFDVYNGGHDYACWRGSILPRVKAALNGNHFKK